MLYPTSLADEGVEGRPRRLAADRAPMVQCPDPRARRPMGTGCPTKMAGAPGPGGPAGDPVAPEDTPDAHEEHDQESRGAYRVILLHVILRWHTTPHAQDRQLAPIRMGARHLSHARGGAPSER